MMYTQSASSSLAGALRKKDTPANVDPGRRTLKEFVSNALLDSTKPNFGKLPGKSYDIYTDKVAEEENSCSSFASCTSRVTTRAARRSGSSAFRDVTGKEVLRPLQRQPVGASAEFVVSEDEPVCSMADISMHSLGEPVAAPFKESCSQMDLEEIEEEDEVEDKENQGPCESSMLDISSSCSRKQFLRELEDRIVCVPRYKSLIIDYLKELEQKFRPKAHYMKRQEDITYQMRTILVDWLVEVADEYRLSQECLFMAIGYIDRFLSKMSISRSRLQLLGTTAMFLAAKFQEIYPPNAEEFVYVTDDTYTKDEVLRMEHLVLKVLSFDLGCPTAVTFLEYFAHELEVSEEAKEVAMYLCELSLLEGDPFLQYLPSHVAASALSLATKVTRCDVYGSPGKQAQFIRRFEKVVEVGFNELHECSAHLMRILKAAHTNQQKAIYEKYRSDKHRNVSLHGEQLASPDLSAILRG
ncbi:unnamed protein product [Cyprideis torosa]|uniref:Cyclin A n=1 Tax=Cyprideis torosa TaxID=163714 RepID=A0A7R8W8P5_9CRUS|nr:unnamed protein product [Cyprideis torosa]CAG0888795.1 unnamed protein product [Cyprideis torosa]